MNSRRPRPLQLSVVGHTNVGKTSLMRTLMRDATFGEIAPTAATTRQVEGARLIADGEPIVELFDTPGLEDAGALIEQLEADAAQRHAGPERIAAFLGSPAAAGRFEQEARVLTQVLDCDAAVYVIDAREPVLGKYQDELAILAMCARPVLPVLNFVANPHDRPADWRDALARVGLHAVAEFDTVVFSLESEARLWRRLATLAERHAEPLERLIAEREARAGWQIDSARSLIAELLVDAAAARRTAERDDAEAMERAHRALREAVACREQRFVDDLLELFRFAESDYRAVALPIEQGRWLSSPFDTGVLAVVGRQAGGGVAGGAAAGAAVDIATGGLTLGAGTLFGALAGGGATGAWQLRREIADRFRGRVGVVVGDIPLAAIAARAFALLDALRQRGHAAQDPVEIAGALPAPWAERGLPRALVRARLSPGLSTINHGGDADDARRRELAGQLAESFRQSSRARSDQRA